MIIYIGVWEKILSLWHKNNTHGAELYIRLISSVTDERRGDMSMPKKSGAF